MISETLYRKYRPKNFSEILGQAEVVQTLQNSLKNNNIAHAYLFSGGRGSGKTSLARIFAQELGVKSADIYEIDAASNRGIEQIRELREAIHLLPLESDYKIYIIDEVHMLTKEAFNALLKTLEEPPAHIIFILATTEKEKILDTIISRCQVLDFKKADLKTLATLIEKTCQTEKVKINTEVILEIAKAGKGSFRDTLSELQKYISLFGKNLINKNLTNSDLKNLVGDFLNNLTDKEKLYSIYKEILEKGIEAEVFLEKLLEKSRDILLIKNSSVMEIFLAEKYSTEEIKEYKKNNILNALILKKILDALECAKNSGRSELALEIFLAEI